MREREREISPLLTAVARCKVGESWPLCLSDQRALPERFSNVLVLRALFLLHIVTDKRDERTKKFISNFQRFATKVIDLTLADLETPCDWDENRR